jgi:hypothetical protein
MANVDPKDISGLAQSHGIAMGMLAKLWQSGISNKERQDAVNALYKELNQNIGPLINKIKTNVSQTAVTTNQQTGTTPGPAPFNKPADSVYELVKFADYLDDIGAYALSDKVTEVATLVRKAAEISPVQAPFEGSLSTRHCPDHCGTSVLRVAENVYQCPIDGKTYNYEVGYINYKGQRVPGGSVAEQTPSQSDFGGIPLRIYDGTQNVLNRIN